MKLKDFTKDEIKYYLSEIKELIDNDCYSIEIKVLVQKCFLCNL